MKPAKNDNPYFQAVYVNTERGRLFGYLIGADGDKWQVSIPLANAPYWFVDAHTSPAPNVWVSARDVELA